MFDKHFSAESSRLQDLCDTKAAPGQAFVLTHVMQQLTREDLEKKTAAEPDNVPAWLRLGYLYKQEKKFRLAVESFKKARKLDPASPKPDLCLGTVFKAMGYIDKAISYGEKALRLDPSRPETHYNLACYYSLKRNAVKSLEHLEQCYALGFSDFQWVYLDPDLAHLRSHTAWVQVINSYNGS